MKILLKYLAIASLLVSGTASALLPFDKTGNLYVSMWTADVVRAFDADGNVVKELTAPGMAGPRGIGFNPHKGEIWVAGEHSDAIYIFNKGGHFKRSFTHPDFNEPLSVTFRMTPGVKPKDQEVYISNSNGNNIMVFDQQGNHLRTFTNPYLVDPNCSAFMADGTHFNSNRLGNTDSNGVVDGIIGRVDKYDANDNFLFSFTTPGVFSLMAVARDPNGPGDEDDTIWATSGGGDLGIYEFDQNGNLLTTILPDDLSDFNGVLGSAIVPQGIAFDDEGNFTVASFSGGVYQFDGDGNHINSYDPGAGNSRSIAFELKNTKRNQ
jgi:outer membrane protein assembly factor BamB